MIKQNDFFEVSLIYKEDEEFKIEKVYAKKIGDYYQIKGIPAFAHSVSYDDIVSVDLEDGQLFLNECISRSGHSVIHIVIFKPDISTNFFAELISFGVNINYLHNNSYLVIDVPPNVSYPGLRKFLRKEVELGNVDVEEASISNKHLKDC